MEGPNGTANIFFTMPDEGTPYWNTFLGQMITSACLMIFVMAVNDVRDRFERNVLIINDSFSLQDLNNIIEEKAKAFASALVIMGITCAFSINAAAAINPVCSKTFDKEEIDVFLRFLGSGFRSTSVGWIYLWVEECFYK